MYYYLPYPARPHPYEKLGGWLKFWVAMVPINLFFTIIIQFLATSFWQAWPDYVGVQFWLRLAIQLCPIYSTAMIVLWAVMVLRRDPRLARTWQLSYIGNIVRIAAQWPLHLIYGYPKGTSLVSNIILTLWVFVCIYLWTLYYAKSVRVRTYMGTDKYLRLAFFTKKVKGPVPAVPDGMA